ncbi:MAG TPA: acyl-CoA dehydrogenase family protein [Candidatus Limnocylindria bacterium]|nr:acyl-CoA dehydrogenase family protein [Candidatus Limnocylindria bacterium]
MELAPTEEQEAIRQAARRFLGAEITRERRLAWDQTAAGYDPAFWEAVSRLGWFGYGLPPAHGGQGASLLDLGLLVEELGRAAAPFALFAQIAGGLGLDALGTPAQKRAWLPAVARGEKRVTLAVAEEGASADPGAFATVAHRRGRTLRLAGEKRYVLQGVTADAFLVAARDGRGVSAVLVPADTAGVRVEPQKTFGKDRQSVVRLENVVLPGSALAGRPGAAWPGLTALRTRLAALLCADMIGGADAVLEMTTRYVCEREQFGVKLGTFQAVQQMVAVMAIDLEGARHVTRQALWRLAEGLPAAREVAVAKAWTGRAYRDATLTAHQLHGGAGYVIEHELHRYSARAKEAELRFGSTEEWLEALADELRLARDGTRPR